MAASLHEIEQQAQKLKPEERAKLVETLIESLHTPVSEIEAAWKEEIEERVSAYERGEVQAISAEEVFAEARSLSH